MKTGLHTRASPQVSSKNRSGLERKQVYVWAYTYTLSDALRPLAGPPHTHTEADIRINEDH